MENKHKIIIGMLIIVIVALGIGIAYTFVGNNGLSNANVPEGMQMYDFNSEFKMAVPENVRFLKEWNTSGDYDFGEGYTYFDKDNKLSISYFDSPLITHEFVNLIVKVGNESGNFTVENDGDLIILHNLKSDGNVVDSNNANFTDGIFLQKGHQIVIVEGNNADLLKSMIKTIEFYE